MSLAGVQTKLAVAVDQTGCVMHSDETALPFHAHSQKPDAPRLWGSVQNEAFCLTLARRMKIPTPSVTTWPGRQTNLFARQALRPEPRSAAAWRRLHQEDYCQALGKGRPSAKYEANQTGISWTSIGGHV